MSFANTLVIMTSNVGSAVIAKGGGALGFQLVTDEEDGGAYSRIRSLVMEELKVLLAQHSPTWTRELLFGLVPSCVLSS